MGLHMNGPLLEATQQFDDLRIPSRTEADSARIVFKSVLFFENGGQPEKQSAAISALVDLAKDVGPNLQTMQTANPADRFEPFDLQKFEERSLAAIADGHENGSFELNAALFGRRPSEVSAFGGSVMAMSAMGPEFADISHLEFSTSLMWDADGDFQRQIERLCQAAEKVGAIHGLAGFGIQYDRTGGTGTAIADSYPIIRRFPGIHCSLDLSYSAEISVRRPKADRYFSINWLTVLGQAMVDELGGTEKISTDLPDGAIIHPFDGGITLQAGPYPKPGDQNRNDLVDYQRMNALTKPVRFNDYEVGIFYVEPPLDSKEESLKWVSRFDEP